jgi:hemolysin activation/secretion protein
MDVTRLLAPLAAATILAVTGTSALAQVAPVDPGRVDERLRERPDLPTVSPVEVPLLPQQEAGPDSNLSVTLREVRFEGATSVPLDVLNDIARPYLNREMPLSGVFQLAEAVTAEYRRRGYVLSRAMVGPQRIDNGVVTIQILEGYVSGVSIEGDAGGYRPFLERYTAPITASRPTDGQALSRALLLARDLKGIDVRSVVTPSATLPGAADLSLVVERRPVEGYVALDNRGSRWLGPVQVYGSVTFNDGLGFGESLSATAVVAPEDGELGFVSVAYDQPVGGSGLRFNGFMSYARTEPGEELRVLGLEGESVTSGFGLVYPFIRSRELNVIGRSTFTVRNAESSNDLVDPIFHDRIRTLTNELSGNYADALGGLSSARLALVTGLSVFDATDDNDIDKSRATGSGEFNKVNFEISRVQPLSGGVYLQAAIVGQWTSDSLLASEEFGLGGSSFGRAFDPSEITGDEGLAAKVELFKTISLGGVSSIEPYVFYETGFVRQVDPLPAEPVRDSIGAAGVGVRIAANDDWAASLEYAQPFERDIASRGDRDGRFFFSISAAF